MKDLAEGLDPDIWMPNLWFFLRTTAHTYPDNPNKIIKRKYYDFIQNIPLFIPHTEWRKKFSDILDSFPITPYLANRESFFFWIHFVENRMNKSMGKEEYSLLDHMDQYYKEYLPKEILISRKIGIQKKYIILAFIFICISFITITYIT
jgi:hypothetical protein